MQNILRAALAAVLFSMPVLPADAGSLWSEDFSSYQAGTGVDGSGNIGDYPGSVSKWSLGTNDCSFDGASDYMKTAAGMFEVVDNDGWGELVTESIDISGQEDVTLDFNFESYVRYGTEGIEVFENVDGGGETKIYSYLNDSGDYETMDSNVTVSVSSGSSLELTFKMKNNAGTRYVKLDDLALSATTAPPDVWFGVTDATVAEDAGSTNIPVYISRSASATVEVAIAGSAVFGGGNDFTNSTTNIVFASGGSTSRTFSVYLMDDSDFETNETVDLTLVSPVGVSIIDPSASTVTIVDDDYLWKETFETDGQGTRYSSDAEFSDSGEDYYGRFANSGTDRSYTGAQGAYWWGGQDQTNNPATIVFSNINISGYSDLRLLSRFAEQRPEASGDDDIDSADYIHVQYRIDEGTWQNLLWFENDGTDHNTTFLEDTDHDGIGDGRQLETRFLLFTNSIGDTGSSLDIQVSAYVNAADEDWAMDELVLTATAVDSNSAAKSPDSQIAAGNISSVADTSQEAVEVLKFKISDEGISDALPTQVTRIALVPGESNTAGWSNTISDMQLSAGGAAVGLDAVSVSDSSVVFEMAPGELDVANGTDAEVTVSVVLATNGIVDGDDLQFMIDGDAHGFETGPEGSSRFAADFGTDVTGNAQTLDVDAARVVFSNYKPPAIVGIDSSFEVQVKAVDANGNVDTDSTATITLAMASGDGALSSETGLAQDLAGGSYTWSDVQIDQPGRFSLLADATGVSDDTSRGITAGGVWINEVDYDNPSNDSNEWIELVGLAGTALQDYELVAIDQDGEEFQAYSLSPAAWTFSNETNGYGFFVCGRVASSAGDSDFTPSAWNEDELQNGTNDSIQLRLSDGTQNVHLLDYEGTNSNTSHDQAAMLADSAEASSSLFLAGGPGEWFNGFYWTNSSGNASPGSVNEGQYLSVPPSNAPSVSNGEGAAGITTADAVIRGELISGYPFPSVYICWGDNDGGESTQNWDNVDYVSLQGWSEFSTNLSGLVPDTTYYYVCYGTNAAGEGWAEDATNFTTLPAADIEGQHAVYIDDLGIGTRPPLSVDADSDGLSDTWETRYFGTTTNVINDDTDSDGDGWTDQQEFVAGTHPTNADSFMAGVSCDLQSEESDNVVFTWVGGGHNGGSDYHQAADRVRRSFRIYGASNVNGSNRTQLAEVSGSGSGTNSWTDVNAAAVHTRRYYDLAVSLGGESYTNAETWAMYVERRAAGKRYLICPPVDSSGDGSNNLNSAAGRQLARGLYAAPAEQWQQGDVLQREKEDGSWRKYYLYTNSEGQIFWWDEAEAENADTEVHPGMAFWILRGTNAAIRDNAVYAGKTYTEDTVTNFVFSTNYGGWAMFGWPLPKERTHSSSDPQSNQLGFYSVGTGGKTSNPLRDDETGDQIWVWESDSWRRYWLVDNVGPQWDGRWWDDRSGDFADFSLQPGQAYYYRNSTNYGGTNFSWRPEYAD